MIDNNSISSQIEPSKASEYVPANVILSVEHVSKRFCRDLKRSMYYGVRDIVNEVLGRSANRSVLRKKEFWALQDVSFQLRQGEAVGLVGANGAGKTTLLKIISGLIKPDTGQITVRGRVAPLIALGAGFNPILSGRENIFINMSILGLTQKEIEDRYDEVVSFSEIGHAIEAPVNTYSSGMAARLGFACAIHTVPDILLIDEVLAVGDIRFRMKCYRRLAQLRGQGVSFVMVSHSTQSLLAVCETGLYLEKGKVKAGGRIGEVLTRYEEDLFSNPSQRVGGRLLLPEKSSEETLGIDIIEVYFRNDTNDYLTELISGQSVTLSVICRVHRTVEDFSLRVIIRGLDQEEIYSVILNSSDDDIMYSAKPGLTELNLNLPCIGLKRGLYTAKISLGQKGGLFLDVVENFEFSVKSVTKDMLDSTYYQQRTWS